MQIESLIPFSDLEKAQLEASAAKVEILRAQKTAVQSQAQFLALAIPLAEAEHNSLFERVKAAHVSADKSALAGGVSTREPAAHDAAAAA